MISKTINVKKNYGTDMVPYLVQSACHYDCSLHIEDGSKKINMKSIMGMTILHLQEGTSFELVADGTDEQKAVEEIAACFE